MRAASTTASIEALAAVEVLLGELDDQDRVLRREADGREQADLEVDVVRRARAATSRAPRRARRAARRAAPRPGSTSSRRAPRGTGTRRSSTARRAAAPATPRQLLLVRQAGPLEADAGRQLADEALHDRPSPRPSCCPARAAPWISYAGTPLKRDSFCGAVRPVRGRERGERHHAAARRCARTSCSRSSGCMRERRVALHVHALHAAAIDEVVDVARRPTRPTSVCVDVGERQAERARLLAVDVDLELRRRPRRRSARTAASAGSLRAIAEQLIARREELRRGSGRRGPGARSRSPSRLPSSWIGRRREREDHARRAIA